ELLAGGMRSRTLDVDRDHAHRCLEHVLRRDAGVRALDDLTGDAVLSVAADVELLRPDPDRDGAGPAAHDAGCDLQDLAALEADAVAALDRSGQQVRHPEEVRDECRARML